MGVVEHHRLDERFARRRLHERRDRDLAGIRRAGRHGVFGVRGTGRLEFHHPGADAGFFPGSVRSPASSGLFGLHGVSELAKALLKCLVVGAVCSGIVSWIFGDVLALARMAPRAAVARGAGLLSWAFVWLCASLALVAVVDVPLQIFQFSGLCA